MKTKAVRLYGKNDLRLEEFELPEMQDDQILGRVVSDSLCMSSYKAAIQGEDHKRVPDDVAQHPIIIGHEFCGEIVAVGKKWADEFKPGEKFSIQPALNIEGSPRAIGYSYETVGGDATYILIPAEVMERGCLLHYNGENFFSGSLSEPLSCVAATFHSVYHVPKGQYNHEMGVKPNGNMAILAGVGPMGLAAIDFIVHAKRHPKKLVVTDINQERLDRAAVVLSAEDAAKNGVELIYLNTGSIADPKAALMELTDGKGYDEVIVFAPVGPVIELGDSILAEDGCFDFFSGPSNPAFTATLNLYNVHYAGTHIMGSAGGNTDDMQESLDRIGEGTLSPSVLVTHIGGLNAVAEATLNLPSIPGGKKLIYTGIEMPLTAIADFGKLGETDPLFAKLDALCKANNGLWCTEAEKLLLETLGK